MLSLYNKRKKECVMKLGISACLLGKQCRYDGGHAKDAYVVDTIGSFANFIPFCPEALLFNTPRDAIRLVEDETGIKALTSNSKEDVTQALTNISNTYAKKLQEEGLSGFILKSKSPSCGLERVKVYAKESTVNEKKGMGLFAKALKQHFPHLPVEEEGRLKDAWLRENFLMQVFAYEHLHNFLQTNPKQKDLIAFHSSYKYLIYAKSHHYYKSLGSTVANRAKKPLKEVLAVYKEGFLEAIALKGSINNTYNVLLHLVGYFKKLISKEEKEELLLACSEFKARIIPLIAVMKLFKLYVKRFDINYLAGQKFLQPYPSTLALRSDLKAYK